MEMIKMTWEEVLEKADVISQLRRVLKEWEIKEYPSDEARWKEYYKDIEKIVSDSKKSRSAFLSRD